jgi:hypothetical protein
MRVGDDEGEGEDGVLTAGFSSSLAREPKATTTATPVPSLSAPPKEAEPPMPSLPPGPKSRMWVMPAAVESGAIAAWKFMVSTACMRIRAPRRSGASRRSAPSLVE